MPAWSGLPTQTQAALTDLTTRLILDHAMTGEINKWVLALDRPIAPCLDRRDTVDGDTREPHKTSVMSSKRTETPARYISRGRLNPLPYTVGLNA
jgi:hypothetical protein